MAIGLYVRQSEHGQTDRIHKHFLTILESDNKQIIHLIILYNDT